jgi:hypothetical protein
MAQNVYSLNTVGYVTALPGNNNYIAICNPVTNTSVANTLDNLIKSNTPANAKVLKWNYAGVHFDAYTRVGFGNGWSPTTGAAATLNPGEGVFVTSPTATNITFVGDVLDAKYYGIQTNSLRSGYELVGSKQPLQDSLPNLGLLPPHTTTPQDTVLKWNVAGQHYDAYTRVGFGIGWSPSIPTNNVGEGFFTKLFAPYTWTQNFTVQ